jgi:DNA-binding MarR family transcriptional regulator
MSPAPTRPTKDPGDEPFLKVLRPLVEAYLAFMRLDERHIRARGLTSAQFDVIATLGDTPGMTCKELCEQTLVTKGTLTGVLDRLTAKGLIERVPSPDDRRSTIIRLTSQGDATFRQAFPAVIYALKPAFERALSRTDMRELRRLLLKLRDSFRHAHSSHEGAQP